MIPRLAVVAFLTFYTAYTLAAAASFLAPVDRWMRRHRVGLSSLRSVLPFWGLFAQRSGMFDLDISWTAGGGGWRPVTANRWRWWSPLWRPEQRADQVSQIVAYRLLAAARTAPDAIPAQPAYRRALAAATRCAAASTDEPVTFRVVLSRGHWTREEPRTVFRSAAAPAPARREGEPA